MIFSSRISSRKLAKKLLSAMDGQKSQFNNDSTNGKVREGVADEYQEIKGADFRVLPYTHKAINLLQSFAPYWANAYHLLGSYRAKASGAWWYKSCHTSNLNGKYLKAILPDPYNYKGLHWNTFRDPKYSHAKARMLIRPKM